MARFDQHLVPARNVLRDMFYGGRLAKLMDLH
jgi:hypothetical protein